MSPDPIDVVRRLGAGDGGPDGDRPGRLTHLREEPPRVATYAPWPGWVDPTVVAALRSRGVDQPWAHQVEAIEHAAAGRHVVVSTGTASGKSVCYQVPALHALTTGAGGAAAGASRALRLGDRPPTVLYLAPTKALARDQLRTVEELVAAGVGHVRPAAVDGDNSREERAWARDHATYVVTNPDLLHRSLLPAHTRWRRLLGGLTYVVVDECHHYRGVFGSHVAHVLRRLRRLAAHHGATPTFVLASATVAEPASTAHALTDLDFVTVGEDTSPRGPRATALWEPPLLDGGGEHDAPVRRAATTEAAGLLTDLTSEGVRTLVFVRSRRAAETVAMSTQRQLAETDRELASRVTTYRGGYLPEERRAIEADLRSGALLGLATTSALELGIDVSGLDAVVSVGFPGTRAALRQQLGRAGRSGGSAVGVFVARDDPLEAYLVHHPDALLGAPLEATVLDPANPYVLGPHLAAAAQELALTEDDLALFGPGSRPGVEALTAAGWLRRRPRGWFYVSRERAADLADIRSSGGSPVHIVASDTGRLLGTVDGASADKTVHDGAVYVHRGETYVVEEYDAHERVALVRRDEPDYTTTARETTEITIVDVLESQRWGEATVCFGTVEVTSRVVSYLRRRLGSAEVVGEDPLDLPEHVLSTTAVWWVLPTAVLEAAGVEHTDVPGSAHAAEHASIGLLPLFASCDRWDIGGVSTALHADTGEPTVFVHDGHPGGAGFARRAYEQAPAWLTTTRDVIAGCACADGCPSCVQSPKCGNGNHPLDKAGAVRVLDLLLAAAPPAPAPSSAPAPLA